MSDIVERLRDEIEARANQAADLVGVTPYSDMRVFVVQAAKVAIERLVSEKDYAVRWANKAVDDVKASYEAEIASLKADRPFVMGCNEGFEAGIEQAAEKVDGLRGIFYQSEGEITHARAFIKDILRDLATSIRAMKAVDNSCEDRGET